MHTVFLHFLYLTRIFYSPDKNLRYGDDYCLRAKPFSFTLLYTSPFIFVCLSQWFLQTEGRRWGLLTRNTFRSVLMCRCYHIEGQLVKIASHMGISFAAIGKFACLLELGIFKSPGLDMPTLCLVNTDNSPPLVY
jgi:hypothetical protein